MGSKSRRKPEKLAQKLIQIREHLKYDLTEIAKVLSDEKTTLRRSDIWKYEQQQREPNLIILLRYAKLVGISTDDLIDDEITLNL